MIVIFSSPVCSANLLLAILEHPSRYPLDLYDLKAKLLREPLMHIGKVPHPIEYSEMLLACLKLLP